MLERVVRANPALEEAVEAGVEVELGVSVWGAFRPGPTMRELGGACVGVADQSRSWLVGYDRLVVAAGARDLGLAFRGWEKAGTMGAAGALALLTPVPGVRRAAHGRPRARGRSAWPWRPSRARAGSRCPPSSRWARRSAATRARGTRLEQQGVRFYPGHVVAAALGSRDEIEGVRLAALDGDLRLIPGRELDVACDTVCLAIGLVPQVELAADPGLPARVPLRARRVRPRGRRRAAHQPARRLRRRRRGGRRRARRDGAGARGGGGPARGTRRGGLARSHRPGAGAGPPARDARSPRGRPGRASTTTGGSGSAPRSRPADGTSSRASARRSRGASWWASSRRAISVRPRPRCARGALGTLEPGRAAPPGPGQAPDARRHGPVPGPALPGAGGAPARGGGRRARRHHPARELPAARPAASPVRPVAPRRAGVDARALGELVRDPDPVRAALGGRSRT